MTLETSQKQVANQHVQHDFNFRFKKEILYIVKKILGVYMKMLTVVGDFYFLTHSWLYLPKFLIIF